eukprot:467607-Rhodomonas_salina.1
MFCEKLEDQRHVRGLRVHPLLDPPQKSDARICVPGTNCSENARLIQAACTVQKRPGHIVVHVRI